jgi:epoxyqueuosine reductase
LKRPGLEGLQRNAAIAIGNRGREEYLPALAAAGANPSPVVREAAGWALARIGGPRAAGLLAAAVANETDPGTRRALAAHAASNC